MGIGIRKEPMSESEIVSFIGRKVEESIGDADGDVSEVRKENFNYYMGFEYGDEIDGYSKYVSREVLEAVEWAMPHILRVFCGGQRYCAFEPVGRDDEEQAERETDIVNYYITKRNNGFAAIYDWVKDALMFPTAYMRVDLDEREHTEVEEYANVHPLQLQQLLESDDEVEILEQESHIEKLIGPGGYQEVELFDLKIKRTFDKKKLRLQATEPEQVLVDNDLTDGNLDCDENDFTCFRVKRTYTQLVEMGYDPEELEKVGDDIYYTFNDERVNRLFFEDENPDSDDEDDDSQKEFWVHDCTLRLDVDGDGLSEMRRIVLIGSTIFYNEEDSYQPFVGLSSIRMPHKHIGLSFVELIKDIQKLQSILKRQLLNNLHRLNIPRKYVGNDFLYDSETLEALMDVTSEIIPCRDPNMLVEEKVDPIFQHVLPVIQQFKEDTHTRTGIAPNLNVDPNTLQEANTGVFQDAMEAMSARMDMLLRLIAETGMKQVYLKVHRLLKENPDINEEVKLRGKWVQTNPASWRTREDVTVNVGIGFHNREQKILLLMSILKIQKEGIEIGLADRQKIFNTLERILTEGGESDANHFFLNPAENPAPQPKPDPFTMEIMAKQQTEQAKLAQKERSEQREMMLELKKMVQDANDNMLKHQEKLTELELQFGQNIPGSKV